ncbi:hypothetical protein ACFS25_05325 [Spirosoma flavum]|uniref:Uncharacterized protein n=1 Tax=Spirosoma flavum TaxID=2048557 RepID=A0ABW6AEW7_9BACT
MNGKRTRQVLDANKEYWFTTYSLVSLAPFSSYADDPIPKRAVVYDLTISD